MTVEACLSLAVFLRLYEFEGRRIEGFERKKKE